MTESARLEELSREECLDLLATKDVGRIAVSIAALPAVLPVNYALMDGDVVFRTDAGTKFTAATENAVVAFEVDDAHPGARIGWSVLVVGHASPITDSRVRRAAEALPLDAWAGGEHFVRVRAEQVTGRRLRQSNGRSNGQTSESRSTGNTA